MDHDEWAALYDSFDGNDDDEVVIEADLELAVSEGGADSVAKTLAGKMISSKVFNCETILNATSSFWKLMAVSRSRVLSKIHFFSVSLSLLTERKSLEEGRG